MGEAVANRFASDTVDFVANERRQIVGFAVGRETEYGTTAVGLSGEFFSDRADRSCEVIGEDGRGAQSLDGVAAFRNGMASFFDDGFKFLTCFAEVAGD